MLYKRETERGNVVREGENKCGQQVVVFFSFLPLEKEQSWLAGYYYSAPQDLVVVKRRLYRHWQAAGRPPPTDFSCTSEQNTVVQSFPGGHFTTVPAKVNRRHAGEIFSSPKIFVFGRLVREK